MSESQKADRLSIRLAEDEQRDVSRAAERHQVTPSSFIRTAALRAARDNEELTTRDRFAIAALAGLATAFEDVVEQAYRSYALADAMILVRELDSQAIVDGIQQFDEQSRQARDVSRTEST